MKHLVMAGPKKSEIKEVEKVYPNDDQILIKLKYVGVCMSEHYGWSIANAGDTFGHEPLGFVEKVGKNVKDFNVGDKVSGSWGGSLPGSGGMVQYAVATPSRDIVVKLPDNIRDTDFILEPLACIMSAVHKVKIFMPGTKVCLVGSGYMGCGCIGLLKLRGAYVVAVDIRQESLEDAKRYGADEVYLADQAKELFSKEGFDVVMEWGETNESLDLAINLTKMCGQLCIGAYHTGGKRLVDVQQLNIKAIDCLSVHPREDELNRIGSENAVRLLESGTWNFVDVPTRVYPMSGFDQAQHELNSKYGKYMKAVIDMTLEEGEPYTI